MSGDHKDSGWRKRQIADCDTLSRVEQKKPQNCGTGYCSCIECVMKPKQEPVACIWEKNDGYKSLEWGGLDANEIQEIGLKSYTPLYTHPPQRTWVGLTDEEQKIASWSDGSFGLGARWAEAKLKEKNT